MDQILSWQDLLPVSLGRKFNDLNFSVGKTRQALQFFTHRFDIAT
jgi:hypothetical protein